MMGGRFKPWTVDVRGLSRKEAAKKRRYAKQQWFAYQDIKDVLASETGREKCKYKYHTSRAFVRENMDKI